MEGGTPRSLATARGLCKPEWTFEPFSPANRSGMFVWCLALGIWLHGWTFPPFH